MERIRGKRGIGPKLCRVINPLAPALLICYSHMFGALCCKVSFSEGTSSTPPTKNSIIVYQYYNIVLK